ncbi:hypothetical protein GCM10007421_35270 [Halopseudomonas oceani]|uniref:Lipoprotein n=1 Tax=Halopseudomonas oceani TaxID=1708783 RepID=A0A2P4ER08_9GAMM|nr:hypothetical protein [Halopseudomonas oceani]POB01069.1 hypothetical protein C1949_17260 [Halopseudomonas oceani]GGE57579.1 hypothetical protein GCM10007421_35270 [Halopseudomonas oceani]
MFGRISLVVFVTLLAGCVSTATLKLDDEHSSSLHEKSLVVTTSDKPDFAAMTAGKVIVPLVGAVTMISEGNKIIRQHNVEDPAAFIGEEIAAQLATLRSMNLMPSSVPSSDGDIEYLSATHANQDFALDVRTINWSFGYFPSDWDNYRVIYSAKARLIDLHKEEVIAEAFCARVPEQSSTSPSYQQLVGDHAAGLKRELQIAAEYCVKELSEKLL